MIATVTGHINRYIVECKFVYQKQYQEAIKILIDTQWNVNKALLSWLEQKGLILIDTQWNVNERLSLLWMWSKWILIDTQWNVNYYMCLDFALYFPY